MARFNEGILYLTGAYGREATESDWNAGLDFQIVSGPYCSIRDCEEIKADNDGDSLHLIFLNNRSYIAFTKEI